MTFFDDSIENRVVFITLSLSPVGVGKHTYQLWSKSFLRTCLIRAEIEGKAALWTQSHPTWLSPCDTWDTGSDESESDHPWCPTGHIPSPLFALVIGKATLRAWGKHIHRSNDFCLSGFLFLPVWCWVPCLSGFRSPWEHGVNKADIVPLSWTLRGLLGLWSP